MAEEHMRAEPLLDLYSTSQKRCASDSSKVGAQCAYHAPYFAYQIEGTNYAVCQGNCHHWDCPRCGVQRAKQEYWRIVQGSMALTEQGKKLYFITITTRGGGLSVAQAEQGYLEWTNRLLSRLRANAKRLDLYWCYVQVTERQKRRHPHSHILTTYHPDDLIEGVKENYYRDGSGNLRLEYLDALRSEYLQAAVCDAGLGEQYDVSEVRSAAAVARYIGKYLFKSSLLTSWPEGWKRVRYSQNWPKNVLEKSDAFPLITRDDWYNLATLASVVTVQDVDVLQRVKEYLAVYPVRVRATKIDRSNIKH